MNYGEIMDKNFVSCFMPYGVVSQRFRKHDM